jgi:putative transposase
MKLHKASGLINDFIHKTLSYLDFPVEHWRRIRTDNPLERIIKEIRRRTRAAGSFPDGNSALVLAAARLRYASGSKWGMKKYLNIELLKELALEKETS